MSAQINDREPIDDGGPAFPAPDLGRMHFGEASSYSGMTLRDYFAAQALSGLLAGLLADGSDISDSRETDVCEIAFSYADKMLKARTA